MKAAREGREVRPVSFLNHNQRGPTGQVYQHIRKLLQYLDSPFLLQLLILKIP